jgi:hypothetical protein
MLVEAGLQKGFSAFIIKVEAEEDLMASEGLKD